MFDAIKNIFGDSNVKKLKKFEYFLPIVNDFESKVSNLSQEEIASRTAYLKEFLKNGGKLEEILPEAFALVREVAKRTLKQRHFDVQILGGLVLNSGAIAEMRTGEGKTQVATLPAYLNALYGKGVHVVTVNDYLSRRDAVWMGQIYSYLGLSIGVINHEASYLYDPNHQNKDSERDEAGSFKVIHEFLRPCSRKQAYEADITYGTNNEFGFDYLRDNLEYEESSLRQRGHFFAIVDEVDSILIDEARTPLIISAPTSDSEDLYKVFAKIADKLVKDEDFTVDEKWKTVALKDSGIEKAEKSLGVDNIYTDKGIKYVHHLETAVRAKALFEKDKEYVVKDGEVVIVDEFTGRLQPGRRWSEGLHQAIEAKEGVSVQKESRTFASITFQNYFRLYQKLSGMTGTGITSSEEFFKVYGLDVVSIPTNKPSTRKDKQDQIFQTEKGKFMAIARKVKDLNKNGQPVLIGTVSIEKNELLSEYLKREGVEHTVLNAKNHEREGEIIAQAGKIGAVTIATNMAGRGVDIKLGGNPSTKEDYEKVKELGGLFVLGTERHEARRIDNQLRGRSGRQGDPGETQFFVSMEDSLMRIFAADVIKKMIGGFGMPEDMPIEHSVITRSLETAQTKIEGFNFDARKHILEFDDVLNHQRKIVYERRRQVLIGSNQDIEQKLIEISAGNEENLAMIEEKKKLVGEDAFFKTVRTLMLQVNDLFWVDHLELMEYARSSVNLRAYGQRDPLVEYKKEGLRLFKEMEQGVGEKILSVLSSMGSQMTKIKNEDNKQLEEVHENAQMIGEGSDSKSTSSGLGKDKVGRNDPCPCGSGKKYKKCHGQ